MFQGNVKTPFAETKIVGVGHICFPRKISAVKRFQPIPRINQIIVHTKQLQGPCLTRGAAVSPIKHVVVILVLIAKGNAHTVVISAISGLERTAHMTGGVIDQTQKVGRIRVIVLSGYKSR